MGTPTLKSIGLTVASFILVTFTVQATSHFVINAEHYAAIPFTRPEPIMPLGVLAMIVQGSVAGVLFPRTPWANGSIQSGVVFAWILGAFLGSYIVLAEPAKYLAPSLGEWMAVEATASFTQFTSFGVLLALVHRNHNAHPSEKA